MVVGTYSWQYRQCWWTDVWLQVMASVKCFQWKVRERKVSDGCWLNRKLGTRRDNHSRFVFALRGYSSNIIQVCFFLSFSSMAQKEWCSFCIRMNTFIGHICYQSRIFLCNDICHMWTIWTTVRSTVPMVSVNDGDNPSDTAEKHFYLSGYFLWNIGGFQHCLPLLMRILSFMDTGSKESEKR